MIKQRLSRFIALITIILLSVFAFLSPYNPDAVNISKMLDRPSLTHLFGTDELGRDYFTRALYGGRVSLTVGIFGNAPFLQV